MQVGSVGDACPMVDDSVFGYDTRSYINAAGSISQEDVPIASLVEYTDDIGFSIGSSLCSLYCGYVGQVALVTDGIVIDESSYVLDEAIVSDDDIVQGGIADARVLVKARLQGV